MITKLQKHFKVKNKVSNDAENQKCDRLVCVTEMNRFDNTSKQDKEDDNDARGNCTKQSKILGKFEISKKF